MWQGIIIILVFLAITALMITRKIPTLVALPLLAVLIAVVAGVPLIASDAPDKPTGVLNGIVEQGAIRMAAAYCAVIFGSWLGQLLNRTGVTETIIKKSAELGGDRPLVAVLLLSAVTALLFTVLSGLGSIIMVGTIVLPIFISIGIPAATAGCIFLMAFATGLALNVANWQTFASIFNVPISDIRNFEIIMAGATALMTIAFILIQFRRHGLRHLIPRRAVLYDIGCKTPSALQSPQKHKNQKHAHRCHFIHGKASLHSSVTPCPSAKLHAVRIAGRAVEEPQDLDSVLRGHALDAPPLAGVLVKDRQAAAPVRLTRRRGEGAADPGRLHQLVQGLGVLHVREEHVVPRPRGFTHRPPSISRNAPMRVLSCSASWSV